MKSACLRIATIVLGLLSLAGVPAPAADTIATDGIKVFEPGTLHPDTYTVIKRLWTDTWHSAFFLPSFPDASAAIAAMKREAAASGADGVTNVICLPDATWSRNPTSIYCHGLLIKIK